MSFELQTGGEGVDLILAGRLGVQQARALWDALQPMIVASQSVRLQAGQVDEIDTSIIQILLLLSRRTGHFQAGEVSDGLLTALKGRGLEAFFAPSAAQEAQTPPVRPKTRAKAAGQGHG